MDIRKIVFLSALVSLVIASLVIARPGPADLEEEPASRYGEMLKSPGHVDTIRSVGILMLALPDERENVDEQIAPYAWYHQAANMSAAQMQLATSNLQLQLDAVSEVVEEYDISQLALIGMSLVGTVRNLDLYYSANTTQGPVIIRVSAHFPADDLARLYGFAVFEGWQECRAVMPGIQHPSGKKTVSISYGEDVDATPAADDLPAPDES